MKKIYRNVPRVSFMYIAIFLIFEISILITGYLYYKNFEKNFKSGIENQLNLIADLKVIELEHWIEERRGDAQTIFGNSVFSQYIKHYLKNPNDHNAKKEIQVWMKEFQIGFIYDAVKLIDPQLVKKIIIPEAVEHNLAYILPGKLDSLREGKIVFEDFYYNEIKDRIFLKILIPILDEHKLIGIIELRIDPKIRLYQILTNFSMPSKTFEIFLLRQSGNEVVYLNDLKFQKNAALNLRVPLEKREFLAVQAAHAQNGIVNGLAYHGKEGIAYVKKVPKSPWFIAAQIDKNEAYTPLKEKLRDTVLFFFCIFLLAGMGLVYVWRNQQILFYKERILSAEALHESEERFRMMFDKAPLSYQSLDADGNFIDVNETWLETLGYSRDEVIGKWFGDFLAPNDLHLFKEKYPVLKKNGRLSCDFEMTHKNGTNRLISFDGRIAYDIDGNFIQTHGILQDITLYKKAELEQQVLYEIAQSVVTTSNLNETLKLIHQSLGKVLYADNIFVALYNPDKELFSFPYCIDKFDEVSEPVAMRKSLCAYVLRTGKPILCSRELFQQLIEQNEVELVGSPSPSWIGVPLKTPDRTLGVLVLQHYEKENIYSERDIQFLDAIGGQIALIIERKTAEDNIKNERILLRAVIDNIPDSVYCKDMATRKTLVNLTTLHHCKVKSEAEILGKTDFDLFPKEIADGFYADDQMVLKSGRAIINREEYVLDDEGNKLWLLTSKLPLKDENGNVTGLLGIGRDITERKQADEALRESEIKMNAIMESTADGILAADGKGRVIKTNKRFAELWKIPQTLIDLHDDNGLLTFVLEQLTNPEMFISKVRQLYNSMEEDLDLLHFKDGRIFERYSAPIAMQDSSVGRVWSFRDITERKKVEEKLALEQYYMRTLMDNLPDHIYFKDLASRFIRINKAHAKMFDLSDPEQALGLTDFDFFTEEHARQAYEDEQNIIRTGQMLSIEEKETHLDHHNTWVSTVKLPLYDEESNIVGTFGISRNITARKQADQEIQQKNEELLKANSEKDKFFSIIAHDLRSPFNGFLGLTQIMAEELSSLTMDEIQKIAISMRNSATNLYRLLENLLEWSKLQQGLIIFVPDNVVLFPIVDECVDSMKELSGNKGIDIMTNIPADIRVFADHNILQTVIRNLLSNALKYTLKEGKINILAKYVDRNTVELSISDTGIGMDKVVINSLFQLESGKTRKGTNGEPSSGLGLLLCREFVERHNGKLWVESEEGRGSVFYFTIPSGT